jgi:hypothetical protein
VSLRQQGQCLPKLEEIGGDDLADVLAQEGVPDLRRGWCPRTRYFATPG